MVQQHPKSMEGDYLLDEDITFFETWRDMEALMFKGKVKSLGLAHFNKKQIQHLLQTCACKPQILQTEIHPLFQDPQLLDFCAQRGIVVSVYGPLNELATSDDDWAEMNKRLEYQMNMEKPAPAAQNNEPKKKKMEDIVAQVIENGKEAGASEVESSNENK